MYSEIKKIANKEYVEKHKDKIIQYAKDYYQTNKDKIKENNKEYREKHKDKINFLNKPPLINRNELIASIENAVHFDTNNSKILIQKIKTDKELIKYLKINMKLPESIWTSWFHKVYSPNENHFNKLNLLINEFYRNEDVKEKEANKENKKL